jgi:hypothetical protein
MIETNPSLVPVVCFDHARERHRYESTCDKLLSAMRS